jgi:hypothetical protein
VQRDARDHQRDAQQVLAGRSCPSTTAPIAVPSIGSRASIRAKLARGSLAIASWSVTYGITEEHGPTPTPAASSSGWVNASRAPPRPTGVITSVATSMAAPSWSIPLIAPVPASALAIGCPSTT